ncbi:hypothetical protein WN51_10217 [Melipona quadrifasciata]|uniref:Uncharacterized protein n=1 Tax=Melipona quadrifasciata TaxID=166423 RepID=A0A0M9A4L9_9HYME|nr:hypothetical protein WN51_10217 [Melipona quadrifasciata]
MVNPYDTSNIPILDFFQSESTAENTDRFGEYRENWETVVRVRIIIAVNSGDFGTVIDNFGHLSKFPLCSRHNFSTLKISEHFDSRRFSPVKNIGQFPGGNSRKSGSLREDTWGIFTLNNWSGDQLWYPVLAVLSRIICEDSCKKFRKRKQKSARQKIFRTVASGPFSETNRIGKKNSNKLNVLDDGSAASGDPSTNERDKALECEPFRSGLRQNCVETNPRPQQFASLEFRNFGTLPTNPTQGSIKLHDLYPIGYNIT